MRKYYPGITIFKLIGCILVVFGHVIFANFIIHFEYQQMRFIILFLSQIVPCFYIISGFLAYKGWTHASDSKQYVLRYLKWIVALYGLFCGIFIFDDILPELISKGFTIGNLLLQSKILIMTIILNGPYLQFWFIPPLVFGIFASYWFYRRQYLKTAITSAIIGFILSQFLFGTFSGLDIFGESKYARYIELIVTRYIGYGFTFVLTGILIARFEDNFLKKKVSVFLIPTIVLSVIELLFLFVFMKWNNKYSMTFSMFPSSILLFYGVLRIKINSIKKHHHFINLFSMVTFFGHILLMKFNFFVFRGLTASMGDFGRMVEFLLILLECYVITYVVIERKRLIKLIKQNNLSS